MKTVHMSVVHAITEEVSLMMSEESRRKLRKLNLDTLVVALDNHEANILNSSSESSYLRMLQQ